MIRKLYPGGRAKAFILSYDDGVLQDRPFVELLNRYGLKGTFNLNSGLMEREFAWTHPSGAVVRRLTLEAAAELIGYLRAMRAAQVTESHIGNPGGTALWFEINGRVCEVGPYEEVEL